MSFVGQSNNYIWWTTAVLGKGATATVFRGENKNTGEPVAVKTFHLKGRRRPDPVQMREFDVLKKVNHENIVKLLVIENELNGLGEVIIMELCTGGSLLDTLLEPENAYGLPERDFLLVLEHLCSGMKYLRDKKIVHRDLKPGNIMKYISVDGQTTYKLTDFGAARELEEDQSFDSLYGTEEYLHPDLYERALIHQSLKRTFAANVDLWSIGVTLFHVATGKLPFQPYGGRRNRYTMHEITKNKASGVISGQQHSPNGPIEYAEKLPSHCHLTAGLRTLITPLLAGLLEANPVKSWSYDKFFQEVALILRKKIIHVFFVNHATSIEVFLEPEDNIEKLREHIFIQTEVSSKKQILLFNKKHLESQISALCARDFPTTELEKPIFLYSYEDDSVQLKAQSYIPMFPVFEAKLSIEDDAIFAKAACIVAHECKRQIECLTITEFLIKKSAQEFIDTLRITTNLLQNKSDSFHMMLLTAINYAEVVALVSKDSETEQLSNRLKEVKATFDMTADVISQLIDKDILSEKWRSSIDGEKYAWKARSSSKANYFIGRLSDSRKQLLRDRLAKSDTEVDLALHKLEKIKIDLNGKNIKALLLDDVQPSVGNMTEFMSDWYKLAKTIYIKLPILDKELRSYYENVRSVCTGLNEVKDNLKAAQGQAKKSNVKLVKFVQRHVMEIRSKDKETEQLVQNLKALRLGLDSNENTSASNSNGEPDLKKENIDA